MLSYEEDPTVLTEVSETCGIILFTKYYNDRVIFRKRL